MEMERIARYCFVAFLFLAIGMGLIVGYLQYSAYSGSPDLGQINGYVTLTLLIFGIIVGLVSITSKEVMPFLIAAIALIVASSGGVWSPLNTIHELLYQWATYILRYIVAFAAPAAVINAIRSVLTVTRDK
ncbi:hypothetical protein MUP01_11315 [Candidatus Bathyarchaeota archaeon]|nr:hypothetical protein [Candidatus Bathyarchaeota archaeon]